MPVPDRPAAAPLATSEGTAAAISGFVTQVMAVAGAEIAKLRHDPSDIFMRAVQPAIWLVLFGGVMAQARGISPTGTRYLDFLAPGILAQSVLFAAIFYGISAIWERDLGVLHRYMVSPAPRVALVLGKALSAALRGLTQGAVIYVLALALGISVDLNPGKLIAVGVVIAFGSALFSTFSLVIACIVRTRERFMGIGQLMTMPIFFASNAIYPIEMMPDWLKAISHGNPLTYQVDALRALMLTGGVSKFGIALDLGVLGLATGILVLVAARLYPRMTA